MNELLKVNYGNDRITLSARELHGFLGIGTEFAKWMQRMCEYGFSENQDYRVFVKNDDNSKGGRPSTDYEITLDMAKEIAMIQRSDKGKEVRQYFLELERRWNSPEAVMNRALEYSRRQVKALMEENQSMKPKALFADAVTTSKNSILVGDLAKILKQNGVNIGANRLFAELRNNGYLIKRKGSDWNMPTQKSMELGLFEIKEHTHIDGNGCNVTTKTPKVTGKGQIYFVNKYLGKNDPQLELDI